MRKLTILLALALVGASTVGCCGRCRNWFKKGSPCGTAMATPILSTPVAMSTPCPAPMAMTAPPIMAGPTMVAPTMMAPNACCDPCVPCCPNPCDPCAGGMVLGYGGTDCCDGSMASPIVVDGSGAATMVPYPGPTTSN